MLRTAMLAAAMSSFLTAGAFAQGSGTPLTLDRSDAIIGVGMRAASFLQVGVGARAQALAGAASASTSGATALYWNTAATAEADGFSAAYSAAELYKGSDLSHNFFGVLLPTRFGTIGASAIQLGSGEMIRTTARYPFGGDPEVGLGNFEWVSLAVGLHYAARVTDRLAIGVAAKMVNEGITGASAAFLAADVSTVFDIGFYGTTLGATLSNIGTSSRMEGRSIRDRFSPARSEEIFENRRISDVEILTNRLDLPTAFRLGFATSVLGTATSMLGPDPNHAVTMMTEFGNAINTDVQTSIAAEYAFNGMFFLRGGKQWLNEAGADHRSDFGFGLSAGAGLHLPIGDGRRFMLDYGYVRQGDLSYTQVISFELSF